MRYIFSAIILSLLMGGCSTRGVKTYESKKTYKLEKYNKKNHTKISTNQNDRSTALYEEYVKWKNTPYEYGGDDKGGIDCSSFIQQAYYGAFKVSVPRTTREQSKLGYKVSKSRIEVGDMVFFKTAYNKRHVGIVIEKGKFVHTSTKKGVTISKLDNKYWRDRYWQARRILP